MFQKKKREFFLSFESISPIVLLEYSLCPLSLSLSLLYHPTRFARIPFVPIARPPKNDGQNDDDAIGVFDDFDDFDDEKQQRWSHLRPRALSAPVGTLGRVKIHRCDASTTAP